MSKELIIDGSKIRYFDKLNGEKTVFVFLHGWGSNHQSFSSIYERLDNYVAFDFPGFGQSSKLKKVWILSDYAKITKKFIDKKLSGKEIIFVAHSFGGRVLVNLLEVYSLSNIKHIIFIGVPFIRKYGIRKKIIFILTKSLKAITFFLPIFLITFFRKSWYKIISASDYFELTDKNLKETFQNIINEDISKCSFIFKKYKASFIWGEKDIEAPLSEVKIFSKKMGVSLYIIKGAGHFPFIKPTNEEFMKVFNKIIKK